MISPQRMDAHRTAPLRADASRHSIAAMVTPERPCTPGAQASQPSTLQPAGLASAARHDAGAPALALTLAAVEPDWLPVPPRIKPGACPEAVPGASQTRIVGVPGTYKEERWGCCISFDSGAGLSAAPSQAPRGNCPTTPHPRRTSTSLGQPSTLPSCYKLQDSQALHPGRPSLG